MATAANTPPKLNSHLKRLFPYPPGRPVEEVQREFGLTDVVKLASNENPLGPSPKALKAMGDAAGEMHFYPDGNGFYLKQALARRLGIAAGEIALGNGSDEITGFLAQAYLGPGRGLVTSNYAFVRYRMAAELVRAPVTLVPMKGMRHDVKAIARAVKATTAMVCLDVPCNPTGGSLTTREVVWLLKRLPSRTILMLDQAYHEYCADEADYPDGPALRREWPNLVVTRTFSKAYGLAGLRIGYAVARPEIVTDLDRIRPPFNTNRMAQAAALAALGDTAHLRRSVRVNAAGKRQLERGFDNLGVRRWPTHANFILIDIGCDGRAAFVELQRLGVIVRPMAGYGLASCLRVSIGTREENRMCLVAMGEVLGSAECAVRNEEQRL
jgi:histidinol-phosphate aminotransferase